MPAISDGDLAAIVVTGLIAQRIEPSDNSTVSQDGEAYGYAYKWHDNNTKLDFVKYGNQHVTCFTIFTEGDNLKSYLERVIIIKR